MGQHLFLNIIPNNFRARTGQKVWCMGAWDRFRIKQKGTLIPRKSLTVSVLYGNCDAGNRQSDELPKGNRFMSLNELHLLAQKSRVVGLDSLDASRFLLILMTLNIILVQLQMNRKWSGSTSAYSDGRPLQSSITKCSCSWEFIKLLEHRVEASVLSPSWLSCFKRSSGGHKVAFQIVALESLCTTTSKVEDLIKLA